METRQAERRIVGDTINQSRQEEAEKTLKRLDTFYKKKRQFQNDGREKKNIYSMYRTSRKVSPIFTVKNKNSNQNTESDSKLK